MIAVAITQTRLSGYYVTAYKAIAQGETYLALLRVMPKPLEQTRF
jgi:hypothetical protein